MDNLLFTKFLRKKPHFDKTFEYLFDDLSKKGGSSQDTKVYAGKHFANNHEFFVYVFFLGLYNGKLDPIPESSDTKGFIEIESFGTVTIGEVGDDKRQKGRKNYKIIRENLFMACIAHADIDLISVEKGEGDIDKEVRKLIYVLEAFANGGLKILARKIEEDERYYSKPTFFLDLIYNSAPKEVKS